MNTQRLEAMRSSLAADGYQLEIREKGGRVEVRISATPQACEDCLVPKSLMRGILGKALEVAEERIDLTYPPESAQGRQ